MSNKTAFKSKHIYTGIEGQVTDGYLVMEDERILAVGTADETVQYIDAETKVYDAGEGFIMPGIHDYHIHVIAGAMVDKFGDLRLADTEEEAAQMLWEKCQDKMDEPLILGGAWDHFRWPGCQLPSKKTLDKLFPNTPVFLPNKEFHGAWGNSQLLRKFNITKDTPDPENGYFERDETGEPSGYIHEEAMFEIIKAILHGLDEERSTELIKAFTQKANSYGITSVGDVSLFDITSEKIYSKLEESGALTVRIHFSMDIMSDLNKILEMKDTYKGKMVRFNGVKGFIDGTPMGHTGYMLESYADIPEFRSEPLIPKDELFTLVETLDKNEIRVRIHACGDAGVQLCLDAYENALKKNGKKDMRHSIEHIECTTMEDVRRFGELGVIPSIQPDHMPKYNFMEHPFHTMLGEERMRYCWPLKSLFDSTNAIAYGTDYPVAPLLPTRGIWRAISRTTDEGDPRGGWNPNERLTLNEVLKSCTYGPAYAVGRENELGTLEPGKFADFAIFNENIADIYNDREKMFGIKTLMTIMNGKIVYGNGID